MEKQEKIRCGSGKKKNDTWLQVSVNPEIINQYVQDYNGKKYVKLNINIGKPDKFGKDISISIDTWTPNGELKPTQPKASSDISSDDSGLPF